ncbi:MAG TPA: nucleotide exchange factor GrpE [Candidatus Eisenbacteria bacterium]
MNESRPAELTTGGAAGPGEPAAAARDAGAEPGAAAPPADAAALAESYRDRWLRAEAELQNFRRRAAREWDEARRGAEERVMLEMIGALDDLDRALGVAAEAGAPEAWVAGVRLTAQRLREYLARQGVVTLEPLGERFDPAFHEAMLEIDAPAGRSPGEILQVVLKGYARGDRPIRPARVVVARAPVVGGAGGAPAGSDGA